MLGFESLAVIRLAVDLSDKLAASILSHIGHCFSLLWKFWQRRKEVNERQRCFEHLQNVDVTDAKQAAYAITQYGRIFAEDSPRCEEAYAGLISRLAPYKYKKSVDPIDEETLSYYRIYVGMIDV